MVTMLMGVATVPVSRLASTSRSGGHRFKTEGSPHFPLSPLFTPSPFSRVLSHFAVFPFARGARAEAWTCCSCRARETSQQWQGARRAEETGR
ncbi:hypothetical protein Taro_031298 [Colocasia esculenta]|uniref:Uncharacterized protein n=1 Tax=Colocasia esculenta TaxID=4460 RepID=A0A843VPN8_COLES|nr:hypothetical protein [Colocasia esculenta]